MSGPSSRSFSVSPADRPVLFPHPPASLPKNREEETAALAMAPPAAILGLLRPMLGEKRAARLDQIAAQRLPGVVVVLENLHDPHNGGAVMRSCEAFGICEVHVICSQERFRASDKVTQGCDKWLDVFEHTDTESALWDLKQRGFRLAAAVPGAKTSLGQLDPRFPTALLLGNEHAGLSAQARALCEVEFAIPLFGFSESLNLSVAAAVCVCSLAQGRRTVLGATNELGEAACETLRARYYLRSAFGHFHPSRRLAALSALTQTGPGQPARSI